LNPLDQFNLTGKRRLPLVLSAEGAECGLACLVMIGAYYGHNIDLNGMRQRYSMSMSGATLRNIMDLASQMGFSTRPIRLELDGLRHIKLPAIAHWNLDHFVVIHKVGNRSVTIHDPALGVRQVTMEAFSRHFSGVALELEPASNFEEIEAKTPVRIRSLWSDSSGLWKAGAQILVLSFVLQALAFIAPLQMQLVVDEAIGRGDRELLSVLAWGFGALLVIQALISAIRAWVMQVISTLFSFQLIGNLVRHLLRLPSLFFDKRHLGDILSRMGSSRAIQDAITRGIITVIIDGFMALVAGFVLFLYSPLLAVIVIGALFVSLCVTFAYYPILRRRTLEQLQASAKEQSYLMETIRAATTVKVMGRESVREAGWRNLFANATGIGLLTAKYNIWIGMFQSLFMGLQTILVVYLAARMVLSGSGFSVGMLMAFMSYRQTFSDRVLSLINQALQFSMLGLHLQRLGDIVTAAPEASLALVVGPTNVNGTIEVRNVSFRYGDPDPSVLKDVCLEIVEDDYLAITGPSGSGKSTLLKLMLGLLKPCEGQILLDGKTATPERWVSWRERVGVVAQNDNLLSGSIADNIAFFDPDLDMQKVHEASQQAQIHDDIMQMSMQYLSLIGDMGSALSGGQKQRILLARALYRKPKILILDEGTANLDEATEELIAQVISDLQMTRIVVAHRPALVQRANRVVEIDGGVLNFTRGGSKILAGIL
jgi:ATP-binding cassette subfamily B protein RaxB